MNETIAPPPLPPAKQNASKAKPFWISALVIATIGFLPIVVYLLVCIGHADSAYRTGGNPLLILAMGFIGLVLHAVGLVCGIVSASVGNRKLGCLGGALNALILGGVLIIGFFAVAAA